MKRDDLEALARRLDPKLAAAFGAALDHIRDRVTLTRLAELLQRGDVDGVLNLLMTSLDDPAWLAVKDQVRAAVEMGAAATVAAMPAGAAALVVGFDVMNPATLNAIQTYQLNLIREISTTTREGIRAVITDQLRRGVNPRDAARTVKGAIGLTQRQATAVANFRRELETFHERRSARAWGLGNKISRRNGAQVFATDRAGRPLDGITARRLRDFRYDRTLRRALETGKPLTPEQIDKMTAAYERKYLKYRAETIARTESLRALHLGEQEQWRQAIARGAVDAGTVRRRWNVARDERTCPTCSPIPRLNPDGVSGVDTPFQTPAGPIRLPPVHPDCRCNILYTTS